MAKGLLQRWNCHGHAVHGHKNRFCLCSLFHLVPKIPCKVTKLSHHLKLPQLPLLVAQFLYEQEHPNSPIPVVLVPTKQLPCLIGKIYVYPSLLSIFQAPSDQSGVHSMCYERIHSVSSWRNGAARHDCIYVAHDPDLPGFQGLYIMQVEAIL